MDVRLDSRAFNTTRTYSSSNPEAPFTCPFFPETPPSNSLHPSRVCLSVMPCPSDPTHLIRSLNRGKSWPKVLGRRIGAITWVQVGPDHRPILPIHGYLFNARMHRNTGSNLVMSNTSPMHMGLSQASWRFRNQFRIPSPLTRRVTTRARMLSMVMAGKPRQ